MADKNVIVLVHGYLQLRFAGKDACITKPDDSKRLQYEGGREFLRTNVKAVLVLDWPQMASSEIYIIGCKTGVLKWRKYVASSSSFLSNL